MPGAADTASAMACLAVAAAVGAVARVPPARVCARACRAARALAVSPHPARRRSVLRRARRDTDSERPSKDGTLDALDNVLGVEPEDEAPPDPSRDADAVPPSRPPVPPAEASSRRLSDAAEDDDDDGWRPWFSPRSDVYDVPVSRPSAAYILALIHVLVFLGDYALYATGNGNGGDLFLRLAEVDDALVRGSQWTRPFTACLVDYGLVHFAVSNLALVTVGAEAEALLGLYPFLSVYVLTGAVGVLTVTAFDPNTSLSVGGSDAIFGIFGAACAYSLINIEPEWNRRGCYVRCLQMGVLGTALVWLAGMPTLGAEHVVSNAGHASAFAAGATMGVLGAAPLFSSDRFAPPDAERLNLIDLLADRKDKLYVGLGAASAVLAAESVVVVVKRFLLDET